METLLKNWRLRMVQYRQEADNANSPITRVKAMNKFLILRDCIKELEEQCHIADVVESACICDEMRKQKVDSYYCHACKTDWV